MRESPIHCETCQQEYRFDSDLLTGRTVQTCACGSGPIVPGETIPAKPRRELAMAERQCAFCDAPFFAPVHRKARTCCSGRCVSKLANRARKAKHGSGFRLRRSA